MGCCTSKQTDVGLEFDRDSTFIPPSANKGLVDHGQIKVQPIVIAKANSIASMDSIAASSSGNAAATASYVHEEPTIIEKSPIINEEKALEHEYGGKPPTFRASTQDNTSNAAAVETGWPILVRMSNPCATHDQKIHIPNNAPFMNIQQLKKKIAAEEGYGVKFIHLGKVLKDSCVLVPTLSQDERADDGKKVVRVSNNGVIQAMVYKLN